MAKDPKLTIQGDHGGGGLRFDQVWLAEILTLTVAGTPIPELARPDDGEDLRRREERSGRGIWGGGVRVTRNSVTGALPRGHDSLTGFGKIIDRFEKAGWLRRPTQHFLKRRSKGGGDQPGHSHGAQWSRWNRFHGMKGGEGGGSRSEMGGPGPPPRAPPYPR